MFYKTKSISIWNGGNREEMNETHVLWQVLTLFGPVHTWVYQWHYSISRRYYEAPFSLVALSVLYLTTGLSVYQLLEGLVTLFCLGLYYPRLRKKEGKVLQRKEERLKACQRVWNLSWPLVNSPCPFLLFLFILLIFWLFSPQGPTHLQGAEGSSDKQENQSGFNVCWLLTPGSFPGPVFLNWMIPNCLSSQNHHSIFFTSFGNLFILPG